MRQTGERQPSVEAVSADECERIRRRLCERLRISPNADGVALAKELRRRQVCRADQGGCETPLSLRSVLEDIPVIPRSHMYVNWAHFNNIDRFESDFLIRHLPDLIYPGGDYVDLFDDSLTWIVSIDYECRVLTFVGKEID